ncbi:hypothetical protein AgCh_035123 [Apium graveolens]
MSKQTRRPFPAKINYCANAPLELIHGDLCGPITPATSAGNRFFLFLVDDYSRVMWVYMWKSKEEAFCEFKKFRAQVEKAPYSPQQNGVVERRNRTVVAMARSFLKEMKMPLTIWGEAVRHSVYILNRLPTRAITGKTPYEAWTGEKPNIDHIRVFGCTTHMKIPSVYTKKLDDRSKSVVYLGKEPGTKAHRLYDPMNRKLHVSRDVTFEEKKAWLWETEEQTELAPLETFTVFNTHEENPASEDDGEPVTPSQSNTDSFERFTGDMSYSSDSPNTELDTTDNSSGPVRYRSLNDIYNNTEVVEIDEDLLLLMGVDEPKCYNEAAKKHEWRQAMKKEIKAIEKNKTWELRELPQGHKAIYLKLETVRLLLVLSAKSGWEVHHLDVKTTFLNGDLLEEVYVNQPEGYVKQGQEHLVYKLAKALYGLRQAPRAWYPKLNKCLENLGFLRCPYEHAVYTRKQDGETLIVGVYVDDLLITGTSILAIKQFKDQMKSIFKMSDLGKLSYYLGIEVNQGADCIKLKQSTYARKLLEKAGMSDCNPTKFLMDPKLHITKDEGGEAVNLIEYKSIVGSLRYLVHTRPDIAFAVGIVSRFMEHPTVTHLNSVKRILRYVKGTLEFGLVYTQRSGNNFLTCYSDNDLAGYIEDMKSTGGMVFYLNESLITWVSQKQKCVALSSCEAEFMAATAAACQAIWLRKLLGQITSEFVGPVILFIDNKSAIDLAKNPVFHGRSKHIDIRYHFIREYVECGEIIIKHVSTDMQRADSLTMALPVVKFEQVVGSQELAWINLDYGGICWNI